MDDVTKNPDADRERARMELALREASYDVHAARHKVAEDYLDGAAALIEHYRELAIEQQAQALAAATAMAALGGAMSTHIEVGYMLEQEQATLQHARAHADHEDEHVGKRSVLMDALEQAAAKMREGGLNAEVTPHGIVIHRSEPEEG